MNFLEPKRPLREAKVRYMDADFQVVQEGEFVLCSATGKTIPLTSLRYWNVARQEPYGSAEVAFSELLRSGS